MKRRLPLLIAAAVTLGVAAALWLGRDGGPAAPAPEEERSGGVAAEPPGARAPSEAVAARPASGEPGVAAQPPAARPPEAGFPARAGEPTAAASPPSGAGAAEPPGAGSPRPEGGEAESKATANKDDIRAAIRDLVPQIKDCYEQGLKTNPDLGGKVVVSFVLARAPDGGSYAREGEVGDSTLSAPLVEACVLSKLQGAHFKELKGDGEVRVRYPFKFAAESFGFGGADQSPR